MAGAMPVRPEEAFLQQPRRERASERRCGYPAPVLSDVIAVGVSAMAGIERVE